MSKHIVIAANAVKAKLIGADNDAKFLVSELLSYVVEGHEHMNSFGKGAWDGRASFFEWRAETFPAGFVNPVYAGLVKAGYSVIVKRKRLPAPLGPELMEAYDGVQPFGINPEYSYQPETIRKLERYGQMIAQVATGGGKSFIARTAVKRILRPAIFLTTRQVLMYQMKAGFEEAGFRVGVMGDGDWHPVNGVNVAMVQTVEARLQDEKRREATEKLLRLFELAILEEAHEAGAQGYFNVMNALPNANYRLALTATPFMRADAEANMRLMAVSGQVGMRISEKMLIERGILAKPYFKYLEPEMPHMVRPHSNWQRAYDLGIVQNAHRNAMILDEAQKAAMEGLPVMILVQRKKHGDDLKAKLKGRGLRAQFISGSSDRETRQRNLDNLKTGKVQVLIGSTILDVGVDVPAVGMVILAGGGKAEVALRQRIGRGLRAKKSGPNVCRVIDFKDGVNKYLKDHARQRRAIVEQTPGFVEGILKPGVDFDQAISAAI